MSKTMLINVILEEESRVAIVDNGVLDFYEIETLLKETLKGNIYKGVVENVNASLDAAFVDCGWERPGFLPLDEVNFRVLPALKGRKGGSKIQEHVHPGMELLVQVVRDRIGTKPPSVSTYYSLPGRYLVLTPHTDSSGVSRRIEDEERRSKLKKIVDELRPPEKYGFIVRTAGLDQDRKELARDMGYLLRLWETVEQAAAGARAPSLIYRERGLALRTIRDHLTDDVEEVLIDDEEVHQSALRFIRAVAPHQESRIKFYTGDKPLFTRFNLEEQIETIYKRRVPLKSGGEIVIESTEGMTAIDVNSSRGRESSVEELALRTNLDAASEIGRQLRLRDIGGLIVIDFIDMEKPKHLRAVEKALADAMRADKAKYDATKISKLGMMEISRQRLKAAKSTATYITCTGCDGAGSVKTTEAAALSALRKIQTRVVRGDIGSLGATLPTDVALYLLNQQRDELRALELRYDVRIAVTPRPDYPKERCDLEIAPREGPAPAVTREAQKRRLEARDERHAASPRRPAVGDDVSLDRVLDAEASVAEALRTAPSRASQEASGASREVAAAAREDAGATREHARAAKEDAGASKEHSVMGVGLEGSTSTGSAGAVTTDSAASTRSVVVWQDSVESPAHPPDAMAPAAPPGSPALETVEEVPGAPEEVPDARPENGSAPDGGAPSPAMMEEQAGETTEAANVEGAHAPGSEPRKRRRRRGGRGRKKHPADGPGISAQESLAEGGADDDDESTGQVIWEDVETPAARVDHSSAPHAAAPGSAAEETHETEAGAHAKKRRRRRGGRGRAKTHEIEVAKSEPEARPIARTGAEPKRGPQRPAGGDVAEAHKKRRRRRGKKHDGPPAEPTTVAHAPVVRERPAAGVIVRDQAGPGSVSAGEEDVPGGWWSRLRGPKKRGDRED